MRSEACSLVFSDIVHVRHGQPSHYLHRFGLSVLIDLDRLEQANRLCQLFSVNRFNLLSFHEADFGPNHPSQNHTGRQALPLAQYVRDLASPYLGNQQIKQIKLMAFPRILGMAFNPITVYLCYDEDSKPCLYLYEVHNTFGDAHSYIALPEQAREHAVHKAKKAMHVSPFFEMEGHYLLRMREKTEAKLHLFVRYIKDNKPLLTATLRGEIRQMNNTQILKAILLDGFLPLRPLIGIHVEALKLFLKKCTFFRRPLPAENSVSVASPFNTEWSKKRK